MDDGGPNFSILVIIICLVINIIINGFGSSYLMTNENNLEDQNEKKPKKVKKFLELQDNPTKFINTLRAVTMLTSLLLFIFAYFNFGFVIENSIVNAGANDIFAFIIAYIVVVGVVMIVNLSIGILIPKKLAARNPESWSVNCIWIIVGIMTVFTPVTIVVNLLSKVILKVFNIDIDKEECEVTEEEIMLMVNEGHEHGVIEASEAEMITNIFEYGDKDASDIMTNRKNIVAIDGSLSLRETMDFIIDETKSRMPVYVDDIDNIIGILHIRDAMEAYTVEENHDKALKDLPDFFTNVLFIPETRKLDDLFKRMQSEKKHMVIVVDEYGQTAGLITMEDILEEIVGNILDEHDEEETNIQYIGDETYMMKGMTTLEEIEEKLGIEYEEEDYDTINGYLISKLDRIPGEDERPIIEDNGNTYKILAVENKMISMLELIMPGKEEPAEEEKDNKGA